MEHVRISEIGFKAFAWRTRGFSLPRLLLLVFCRMLMITVCVISITSTMYYYY